MFYACSTFCVPICCPLQETATTQVVYLAAAGVVCWRLLPATLARVLAVVVSLCVCLCVCHTPLLCQNGKT